MLNKLMIESVIDLDKVVVILVAVVFIGVVEIIVVILGVIENVERQFHAQLSEKNVVVGEERVTQRKLRPLTTTSTRAASSASSPSRAMSKWFSKALSRRVSARRASPVMTIILP